jgi:hypothetical protein
MRPGEVEVVGTGFLSEQVVAEDNAEDVIEEAPVDEETHTKQRSW